jgi:hypothetical protein
MRRLTSIADARLLLVYPFAAICTKAPCCVSDELGRLKTRFASMAVLEALQDQPRMAVDERMMPVFNGAGHLEMFQTRHRVLQAAV